MKTKILLTFGLVALLAPAVQAGQEQLAASMKKTREETAATLRQLNSTLASLNALVSQEKGSLEPAFKAFQSEVPKTQEAAKTTNARAASMTTQKVNYFSDWQASINSINSKSLQKKGQKRLKEVSKSYDEVEEALMNAGEKFRPFLANLSDIQKVLSQDVTAGGVKAIKGTVRDANWSYKAVVKSINEALHEMGKMERALSTQAAE
jgi:hypothetical protein